MKKGALEADKTTKTYWFLRKKIRFIRDSFFHRLRVNPKDEKNIVDTFHKLYWESTNFGGGISNLNWMGFEIAKYPTDLWIYQEILNEVKPDVIIESGTFKGGSALYLANLCDIIGKGKILTIDIDFVKNKPKHKRISYFQGSSTSPDIITKIKKEIKEKDVVLVILDSNHKKEHVLNEIKLYNSLVTPGSYLIVEDSHANGHPIKTYFGEGPMEAIREFLKENSDFTVDKSREKFFLTANPNGYLKKNKFLRNLYK